METLVTIERAIEIARQTPISPTIESISITESNNRILAENLHSKIDDPPFDNSAMDGWAVRFNDNHRTEIGMTAAG
ncbi:MAG: molybdopterin molybdenumtransferase MoeA, partial [Candidatus Thermoplasmatota archaeon]|nr:molybdopterin molybdenumtransferase MoeA [Candidatus Thermoplasmatota archaeon]